MPEKLGPRARRLSREQVAALAEAAEVTGLELHFGGDLDMAERASRMARHYRGRLSAGERPADRTARS